MNLRERSDGRSQTQGHATKLSDDKLVSQFSGRSLSEKLDIFKCVLRQSHQTFDDLIKAWIHDTPGGNYGSLRQREANRILDLIWQNESRLLPLFEKTESFQEKGRNKHCEGCSELDVLNTKVNVFGRFDPAMNPEELNLHDVLRGGRKLQATRPI
jgi:hypothetical protein